MQKIQAGNISVQISHIIGFVMVLLSSYGAFILKTIKRDHQKLDSEHREFKKDACIKITELYDCRHEMAKELVQVKQKLEDCQKFHGHEK